MKRVLGLIDLAFARALGQRQPEDTNHLRPWRTPKASPRRRTASATDVAVD